MTRARPPRESLRRRGRTLDWNSPEYRGTLTRRRKLRASARVELKPSAATGLCRVSLADARTGPALLVEAMPTLEAEPFARALSELLGVPIEEGAADAIPAGWRRSVSGRTERLFRDDGASEDAAFGGPSIDLTLEAGALALKRRVGGRGPLRREGAWRYEMSAGAGLRLRREGAHHQLCVTRAVEGEPRDHAVLFEGPDPAEVRAFAEHVASRTGFPVLGEP